MAAGLHGANGQIVHCLVVKEDQSVTENAATQLP